MELNKKTMLFCVIIQLLFCEVHPVPDGYMNETKDGFGFPSGLGEDTDSKGGMENRPPTAATHHTSTPATLAFQPITVNLTSAERNQTGSEAGETLLAASGGNQTLPGSLGKTNMTHGDDDVIVTSNMTSPGNTITSSVTQEEGVGNATTITYPDTVTGNATDDNSTVVLPVGTGSLLPVPAATLPPDGSASPAVPGVSPEQASTNSSSSSIAASMQPTQVVQTTLLPPLAGGSSLPPAAYRSTTVDPAAGGMVRTTPRTTPRTTYTPRGWMFRTTAPHPPPTTTTVTTTTTTTAPRSSTHTHHNLLPPRRPAGGGEAAAEGVEGTPSEGRGEIAGMDPLALGIGICIPVLLIIVVILSVFCYRKYKKGGRGYITLDDFGTFEGMQNPNYDGEL